MQMRGDTTGTRGATTKMRGTTTGNVSPHDYPRSSHLSMTNNILQVNPARSPRQGNDEAMTLQERLNLTTITQGIQGDNPAIKGAQVIQDALICTLDELQGDHSIRGAQGIQEELSSNLDADWRGVDNPTIAKSTRQSSQLQKERAALDNARNPSTTNQMKIRGVTTETRGDTKERRGDTTGRRGDTTEKRGAKSTNNRMVHIGREEGHKTPKTTIHIDRQIEEDSDGHDCTTDGQLSEKELAIVKDMPDKGYWKRGLEQIPVKSSTVTRALGELGDEACSESISEELRQHWVKQAWAPINIRNLQSELRRREIRSPMSLQQKFVSLHDKLKPRIIAEGGYTQDKALCGIHADGESDTGSSIVIEDTKAVFNKSCKSIVTKSPTEAELVAASDAMNQLLHARELIKCWKKYQDDDNDDEKPYLLPSPFYQNNKSTIELIKAGRAKDEKPRHINTIHAWIHGKVKDQSIVDEYMPTKMMIANVLTKPLQGEQFRAETATIKGNQISPNETSEKLDEDKRKYFHTYVAKLLHLVKRTRPECLVATSFLCTRVTRSTKQDKAKLDQVMGGYLRRTPNQTIVFGAGQIGILPRQHVDASYGLHADGKSHTGSCIAIRDTGAVSNKSSKQIVTKSSTEAELVSGSDALDQLLHARELVKHQDKLQSYKDGKELYLAPSPFYQGNKSTIELIKTGRAKHEKSRHIDIRQFWIHGNGNSSEQRQQ